MARVDLESTEDYLKRYPRICAHIIAESLGYATPLCAAQILRDANEGRSNYCEWVASCYNGDAKQVVANAIRSRHHHKGYMASYEVARAIVERQLETGEGPVFASWF